MSQIEYSQTLGQQEEMEYLLTAEAFHDWRINKSVIARRFGLTGVIHDSVYNWLPKIYLKDMGLSLTSEIKGL